MTTAKWTTNTAEQQDFRYRAARFNEKECLPAWGGDALSCTRYNAFSSRPGKKYDYL
jgi:hypothetical protein